jgi:hypothetical protein
MHAEVVANFRFTPQDLAAFRTANLSTSAQQAIAARGLILPATDGDPELTCGIIDEWYWATRRAYEYCASQPFNRGLPRAQQALPVITSPGDYLKLGMSHHSDYKFVDGDLVGACVACSSSRTDIPPPVD